MEINLTITLPQLQVLSNILVKQSFLEVHDLMAVLNDQATPQVIAIQKEIADKVEAAKEEGVTDEMLEKAVEYVKA